MATMKDTGFQNLMLRAISSTVDTFPYGALSSNATAESTAGTTLTGEIGTAGLGRAAMTCTQPSTYVIQWAKSWTSTQTIDIMKFAIFSGATSGSQLMEHLFSGTKGLVSGESLTITAQMMGARA